MKEIANVCADKDWEMSIGDIVVRADKIYAMSCSGGGQRFQVNTLILNVAV